MKKHLRPLISCCLVLLGTTFLFNGAWASPKPGGERWQAQQIFSRIDPEIEATLQRMTLSEKVGQMLIAESEGHLTKGDDKHYRQLSRLVQQGKVGGIMFLKGEVIGAGMLANHFQTIAPRPLLLSADMEKGLAMRLKGATEFPTNMAIAATRDPELAGEMSRAVAREAKAIGLNQNYGPTLDLNINPLNPVINTRSFGDSVPLAIAMSSAIIEGLQSNGVIATAKHFPGHGDVTVDSHKALPVLEADRQRLEEYELKPFRAAIAQGVISIMTGHLAVPKLTGSMEPASISRAVVTDLLRGELGFQGLIITDALNMSAVNNGRNVPEISVKAVKAGNDLLLFSPDPDLAHRSIMKAVEKGEIPMEQINASVRRILQVKSWLELEKKKLVNVHRIAIEASPASHQALARKIASRSVTLIRDRNNDLPLKTGAPEGNILDIILQDKTDPETGKGYIKYLDRYYQASHIRIDPGTDSLALASIAEMTLKAPAVIVTSYVQTQSGSGTLRLTERQQLFIHSLTGIIPKGTPMFFVSLGTPYLINTFPELSNYLCTYSSSEASEECAVELLRGKLKPVGVLPVSLKGNPL
ncbi:MAG: glycoside hydrolase family 3 protein [Chlorobiaceae bacterium]